MKKILLAATLLAACPLLSMAGDSGHGGAPLLAPAVRAAVQDLNRRHAQHGPAFNTSSRLAAERARVAAGQARVTASSSRAAAAATSVRSGAAAGGAQLSAAQANANANARVVSGGGAQTVTAQSSARAVTVGQGRSSVAEARSVRQSIQVSGPQRGAVPAVRPVVPQVKVVVPQPQAGVPQLPRQAGGMQARAPHQPHQNWVYGQVQQQRVGAPVVPAPR